MAPHVKRSASGPLIILIYNHLRRLGAQFAAMAARAHAAPRRTGKHVARRATWPGALVPATCSYGGHLHYRLLTDPEMADLIAAVPQVKRLPRSILWATALT